MARRATELDTAVGNVRGEAYSPNGSIYLEVDLYGAITDLRLTEYAMEHGPKKFAQLIEDCHARAHSAALADARRVHETVRGQHDSRGAW